MFRRGVGVFNGRICSVLRIAVPGSVFLGIEPQLSELSQLEPSGDRR